MVDTIDRIVERLPAFYRAWDPKSNMFTIIRSLAESTDEQKKDLFTIMRSHWVDTAFGKDLDLLGSIFRLRRRKNELDESFRIRIKYYIVEFLGGGTREAVLAQTNLFLGAKEGEVIMIENPPFPQILEKAVKNGAIWQVGSNSINDESFSFSFSIEQGDYELEDPTIRDEVTGLSLSYKGLIKSGQRLTVNELAEATLDKKDVTKKISNSGLKILRKGSKWSFRESTSPSIGRFDEGVFNTHVFETFVPTAFLRFEWTARLLSSFELKIAKDSLQRSGVTREELEYMVSLIKAAGVKSFITVEEPKIKGVEEVKGEGKEDEDKGKGKEKNKEIGKDKDRDRDKDKDKHGDKDMEKEKEEEVLVAKV